MGKALYRKYRSKDFDQLIGQEHITKSLFNAIKNGNISHAYLFTGPRGVGKTSVARILAHAVNDLPYTEDDTHLDIIEIDAASNRRIDEIRELRERVHNAPTSAKYKVYIIDEVHMLTKEAFNALLKTLEEPPEHVIFILATTEAHKLPETIISRTQRFTFKPIDNEQIVTHLRHIAQKEKITITDEALAIIAQHGGGSFRDSISLLDQAKSIGETISEADVLAMLGVAPDEQIITLDRLLSTGTAREVTELLAALLNKGIQPSIIAKQLTARMRADVLAHAPGSENKIALIERLIDVAPSHDPQSLLEIILIRHVIQHSTEMPDVTPTNKDTGAPKQESIPSSQPSVAKPVDPIQKETTKPHTTQTSAPKKIADSPKPHKAPTGSTTTFDEETWQSVLQTMKGRHNTLYGLARMAEVTADETTITLLLKFPFHQKRLSEAKNTQKIIDIISEITGNSYALACKVLTDDTKSTTQKLPKRPASEEVSIPPIDTITDIFGSVEVLE